ncbi:MAG: T9SS type A sorting domain-containing protein [Bacteroidota bacterium]|nr:T9SS type A sorting domain-containing protein [Bacteroidota bacterium]
MKEWRGCTDNTPPAITASIDSIDVGGVLTVQTDEPLWQAAPLVYVLTSGDVAGRIFPEQTGAFSWRARLNLQNGFKGTVGIAATDTSGNSAVKNIDLTVSGVRVQGNDHFTYKLNDAFPNPFNPTTHVRFTVADFQLVTLKVYDVLGREVATLVNEQKSPGTYEVNFDASSLSSGVYFYRLQSGSFTDVKKMVVEK